MLYFYLAVMANISLSAFDGLFQISKNENVRYYKTPLMKLWQNKILFKLAAIANQNSSQLCSVSGFKVRWNAISFDLIIAEYHAIITTKCGTL